MRVCSGRVCRKRNGCTSPPATRIIETNRVYSYMYYTFVHSERCITKYYHHVLYVLVCVCLLSVNNCCFELCFCIHIHGHLC